MSSVCGNMEVVLDKCADNEIIKLKSASYIKSVNCSRDTIKSVCTSNTSLERVSGYCNGNTTCTIPVNDDFFEAPCINQVEKCVTVEYKCGEQGKYLSVTKSFVQCVPCVYTHAICLKTNLKVTNTIFIITHVEKEPP